MPRLTFKTLRWANLLVGAFQTATGAVILGISDYNFRGKLPWYTNFIESWSREDTVEGFYEPVPDKVVNFPIGVWSGAFLLLSGFDHLIVSAPGVNGVYNRLLCRNQNPFRWIEYSVSASIMNVMVAQLSGTTDIHTLWCIAWLTGVTMLFGLLMERMNGDRLPTYVPADDPAEPPKQQTASAGQFINGASTSDTATGSADALRVDWLPFLFGWVPFIGATAVIGCFFFQAAANAGSDLPGFVWSIFFIELGLFSLFAVNQWLQFAQVRGWRGFARAELWYIVLSLSAKQLLAWINYGGSQRFEDE